MKIAIQAADLDATRIDGTRVYILNLLKLFGQIDSQDEFLIYHKKQFNPELTPPDFFNYKIIQKSSLFSWSQTRFAFEIWKDKPDVLWMPMQSLPFFRRKNLKTVITIHDLAFKYFPDFFPKSDLRKLNLLTDYAVKNSNKVIAVSESTKKDILQFYPEIPDDKIKVIHHGFDPKLFSKKVLKENSDKILKKYFLEEEKYLLYVGALQPRKNLSLLVEAFGKIKENYPEIKLVLAGEKAWLWKDLMEKIDNSPYKKDIVLTGKIPFEEIRTLYQKAMIFIFPSLYEGFGIPILEAFASEVPVVASQNSSLSEVGQDAVSYFETKNQTDLENKILALLDSKEKRKELIERGLKRVKNFSWEKTARETLEYLKN